MTTLTRWLLRAFADEWPGGLPSDLFLEDRENSQIVIPNTSNDPTTFTEEFPTADFDLERGNVLGVAVTDWTETPSGLGGMEYQSEPVLSVRVQGASERKGGHIADADEFVNTYAKVSEDVVRKIDNGTLQDTPNTDAYSAETGETNPQMSDHKDAYVWQYDVNVQGYRQL